MLKNILFIVKRDLRNISKNKAALIVIAAVTFLPSLYAWVNIKASWDPYANTQGVSVAVTSNDKGTTIKDTDINVGDEVIVSLTKNDSLGWKFVPEEEAIKGVEHGDYYAAIVIPEDFSEKLGSVTTHHIEQPELDYYINEKVNAISPKVTDKGASAIVENIQSTFIEEVNDTALKVFNSLGIELDNNMGNIERARDIIFELEDQIPNIYSDLQLIDKGLGLADVSIDRIGESLDNVDTVHANAKRLNERLVKKLQDNEKTVNGALGAITSNLESAQDAFREVPRLTTEFSKKGQDLDRIVDSLRDKQDKIDDVNARLDDIYKYLKEQDENLKSSTKIEGLQNSLAESTANLTKLKENLETIIKDLKDEKHPAVDFVEKTQELSDKIAEEIDRMKEQYDTVFYPQTEKLIENLRELANGMTDFIDQASQKNKEALQAVQRLIDLRESVDLGPMQEELDKIAVNIDSRLEKVDTIVALFKVAGNLTGNEKILALEQRFTSLQSQLQKVQKAVEAVQASIDKGESPSLNLLKQLQQRLQETQQRIDGIRDNFDNKTQSALNEAVKKLESLDKEMQDKFRELEDTKKSLDEKLDTLLDKAKNPIRTIGALERMVSTVDRGLSAINSLDDGFGKLQKFIDSDKITNEIEHIKTVQDTLTETKSSVDTVIGRIHEAKADGQRHLDEINRLASRMERSVGDVITFVNGDLSQKYKSAMRDATNALYDVTDVLDEIHGQLPRVRNALSKADNGVSIGKEKLALAYEYFPEARDTIEKLAEKIRALEKEGDLDKLIDVLMTDPASVGKFLANPIELKDHKLYPIPNYGSAMSPFYTTLSLWVGALLLVSSLKVDIAKKGRFKSQETYLGRLIIFAGIGAVQAAIVTLGDLFIMHTYVVNKLPFILFGMLISVVFVTIVYTLVSVFGNTGKVLAIVLMVMQLGGSGGTFPIQMAPEFFQKIHQYLPFTHAIILLRESIGGIIWEVVWKQIFFLVFYFLIAVVFGLAFKKFFNKSSDKFMEKAQKSGIVI
ncbi:YhgE/Pip family protein [Sporosarcina newyorkensis]|uniref:YhgE/Pip family protein n=1 Tax=Sporosarcina newyorkensis TaxID=759851 RepID=UPI003CFF8C17